MRTERIVHGDEAETAVDTECFASLINSLLFTHSITMPTIFKRFNFAAGSHIRKKFPTDR